MLRMTDYTTPRRGRRVGSTLALGPRPIVLTARGRHVVRGLQTLGLTALSLAALLVLTLQFHSQSGVSLSAPRIEAKR